MRIVRVDEVAGQKGATFTGNVTLKRVVEFQQQGGMNVSLVRFEDGARTNWHIHPGEQILIVVEGECRVGTESEEHLHIGPGSVIYLPPNERHWHGAMPGSTMAHYSITNIGSPTWQEAPAE